MAVLLTEMPSKAIVQVSREVQDVGELQVVQCEGAELKFFLRSLVAYVRMKGNWVV